MAKPEDSEAKAADAATTAASNEVKANEVSATAETPDSKIEQAASADTPKVKSGTLLVPVRAPDFSAGERFTADEEPEVTEATILNSSRWRMPRYAPLAAGIVLAIACILLFIKPLPLIEGAERFAELYLVFAERDCRGRAPVRMAEIIREGVESLWPD